MAAHDPVVAALAGEPLLLAIPRVAQLLGISRSRAYVLVQTGVLPTLRLGERRLVVSKAALLRWLETGTASR
jgi:excisionase family DNA binding protein